MSADLVQVTVEPAADVGSVNEPEVHFGCAFAEPWFGASYPDSYCIEGHLHDADGDGYDINDTSNPCPRCNTRTYLQDAWEEAQGTESVSGLTSQGWVTYTGDELWEIAQRWARQENPDDADALIAEISNISLTADPVAAAVGG